MLLREFVHDHPGLFVRFDLGPRGRETGQEAQIELMNCGLLLTLESILDLPHIDHSVSSLWFLPPSCSRCHPCSTPTSHGGDYRVL